MANQKQPVGLIQAKGRKHLTKAEIEQRQATEVHPLLSENVSAPKYLSKAEKERFFEILRGLDELGIVGDTDMMMLGQLVQEETMAIDAMKDYKKARARRDAFLRTAKQQGLDIMSGDYFEIYKNHESLVSVCDQRVSRHKNDLRKFANDFGLTITSRCRIVMPQIVVEEKVNKFARFEKHEEQA